MAPRINKEYKIHNYTIRLVKEGAPLTVTKTITSPEDAYDVLKPYFMGLDREHFIVLFLSSSNKPTGHHTVTIGLLNSSLVHPREVFKPAIVAGCAAIIIAHNHPSGNTEPSREDISITKQLVEASKIVGIPIHDHIICTESSFTSMMERGLM